MRNLKVVIEYDGTEFYGFQKMPSLPTVQGALEEMLTEIVQEPIKITGAGRTDTGVHAAGQVINFRTMGRIPASRLPVAMNSLPPFTIVARHAEEVPVSFHARRDAKSRIYRYAILNRQYPSVFLRRFSFYMPKALDADKMAKAAAVLVGSHDFSSFRAAGTEITTPIREVMRLEVARKGPMILITCEANGFLRSMVRNITGALLEAGLGKLDADGMRRILDARDRAAAPATAPAQGLCLMRVNY